MKNLILIRHAKSSWDPPLQDFDRPLMQRGINDAQQVATFCLPYVPQQFQIFSSEAKRAKETAMIFAKKFSYPIENIIFSTELYTFDERKLETIIKSFPNSYNNVILFGHNEAITNFVNKFGHIFIDNVSTSGFVSLQFDADDWHSIDNGKTIKVIFPKDLN
jgi:phosphohistidine phosphatase